MAVSIAPCPSRSKISATKPATQAFAETLRKEVADRNITVSVIQQGSVDTDLQERSADEKRAATARPPPTARQFGPA